MFFLGGSGMKDVSAWQMLRRWDGLKRTVIGQERGGQDSSKK